MQSFLTDEYTWYTLSFLLLVAIIVKKGGPKILGALDSRIAKIKADIELAESLRIEAQEMLAQYQRKQRDAAVEAEKILKDAKDAALKITAAAEQDIAEIVARREKQLDERLERMKINAIEDIRAHAASLSLEAAQKLIVANLDAKANTALLEASISGLGSKIH